MPVFLMTMLLAGCAAMHVTPMRSVVKRAVARRLAGLVMDEEADSSFTNVTAAVANIKEVLVQDGFMNIEAEVKPEADLAALNDEKSALEEALMSGYDAKKVTRLAEVEAMLGDAASAAVDLTALSPEEAAKAAWLARTYDGVNAFVDVDNAWAAPAADGSPLLVTQDLAALNDEKSALEEALMSGYDAEKVTRLAEVEARLGEAACSSPESTALSPEEAAKAAWLAARTRPWGGKTNSDTM